MAVVIAVLVIAAGVVIPQLSGSDARRGGASAATSSTTAGTPFAPAPTEGGTPPATGATETQQTRITSLTESPTPAPPAPAALDAAESWGKAWVTHPAGITSQQWLDGLRPFTTEEQLTEMASVEPANIVATKVTGDAESVDSFTSSVTVKLPTDDGDLLITVIDTPDGWRVAFYEQVDR
jgi:hypothetical protein